MENMVQGTNSGESETAETHNKMGETIKSFYDFAIRYLYLCILCKRGNWGRLLYFHVLKGNIYLVGLSSMPQQTVSDFFASCTAILHDGKLYQGHLDGVTHLFSQNLSCSYGPIVAVGLPFLDTAGKFGISPAAAPLPLSKQLTKNHWQTFDKCSYQYGTYLNERRVNEHWSDGTVEVRRSQLEEQLTTALVRLGGCRVKRLSEALEFEYTPDELSCDAAPKNGPNFSGVAPLPLSTDKSSKIGNGSPNHIQRRENSGGISQLSWTASFTAYHLSVGFELSILRTYHDQSIETKCQFCFVWIKNTSGAWRSLLLDPQNKSIRYESTHQRIKPMLPAIAQLNSQNMNSEAQGIVDVPTTTNWTHDHWQLSTYVLIKKVQALTFADRTILCQQKAMFSFVRAKLQKMSCLGMTPESWNKLHVTTSWKRKTK